MVFGVPLPNQQTLKKSASSALLLGGGFTIARDIVQFGAMLIMVRLLTPEEYGSVALAQSFIGVIAVFSFGTLSTHALQLRDPMDIDWQAHFTAAFVVNGGLFLLTLLGAWYLSTTQRYAGAALALAGLSTLFLVEIPGTLRHRMLETQHDWIRFRLLHIMGTLLGLGTGLMIAVMGGGVWALIVQPPLFGLPAAVDLFWRHKWRPDWSWSWARYRDTAHFGLNRIGTNATGAGRQSIVQIVMTSVYDFAALGVFTRAIGLANLVAGRIGSVAMQSLYPVVTRAELRSARFQRISGLVLRGVCWTTIPAAAFFAFNASDTITLLYGRQWLDVIPIFPLAVMGVAFGGIAGTLSSLLVANGEARIIFLVEIASAIIGIVLALWLVPLGIAIYLAGIACTAFVVLLIFLFLLDRTCGIARDTPCPRFYPR